MPKQPMDRQRSKKQKIRKSMRLIYDQNLAERYEDRKKARSGMGWTKEDEADFLLLEEDVENNSDEFVMQSIGRKRFREMMAEHAPTDEQSKKAKEDGGDASWNQDTFPPSLVWESLGGKEYCTYEEFLEDWDNTFSDGETTALFVMSMDVNMAFYGVANLGNVSRQTRPSSSS